MSTHAKTKLLRRILHLPDVPTIQKFIPTPESSLRPPVLNAKARSFSPQSCPSPAPISPDPSTLPRRPLDSTSQAPPRLPSTPPRPRSLFPPKRSPTGNMPSVPPLISPPPLPSPPPQLPSLFNTGGKPGITEPSTFPRPTPNSGPHPFPHSPNMGGPFRYPLYPPMTPSSSSHFFQPSPLHVLHPYIHQNIINCLQSINYFFASVLTTIPVHVHPAPYGSNSYI